MLESVSWFRGWGASLTRPPCTSLSVRSLRSRSYVPRVGISLVISWCGSLFFTPLPRSCLVVQRVGSLSFTPGCQLCQVVQRIYRVSYTPRAGMCLLVRRIGSLMLQSLKSPLLNASWLFMCSLSRRLVSAS